MKEGDTMARINRESNTEYGWDSKVMSYVMFIVVFVAVTAVTVAWFSSMQVTRLTNLSLTTASSDVIRVALKSGGEDVLSLEQKGELVTVDCNMPLFSNISSSTTTSDGQEDTTKNQMAPGVYGEFHLYLTPLQKSINRYRITPQILLNYMDGSVDQINEHGLIVEPSIQRNKEVSHLVKGHILFYAGREQLSTENGNQYIYTNQITETTPYIGELHYDNELQEGTESELVLYWYWPYEYDDIPGETKTKIGSDDAFYNKENFYDRDKLQDMEQGVASYTQEQLYDYADTKIGTYISSLKMHLKVDGYHEDSE